ncbi:response regulator transcription factor [Archangium violaceum]|uniref:response regulator transcription factor n=1 Tax=Archangium violaceum TaxID=83451 RepID=UPI00193C6C54|nr:response regulator transcription factor [Archangium violaceum]QRK12202.1 response regulator transcription factor [Archangium violaceum]
MQTGPRIRIGILDDQQLFRESLAALFASAGHEVAVQSPDVEGFLAQLQESALDVAVVDLRLERMGSAEVDDGLRLVALLRERSPRTRVLILSGQREPAQMERCFQAGVAGFVSKLNVSCAELVAAVEQVARGEWVVPSEFVSPMQVAQEASERASPLDRLTLREREVLSLVAIGADNLQISARLGITERTVKAHVSNLYRKLGVQNRVEMAMLGFQSGLSSTPDAHPQP